LKQGYDLPFSPDVHLLKAGQGCGDVSGRRAFTTMAAPYSEPMVGSMSRALPSLRMIIRAAAMPVAACTFFLIAGLVIFAASVTRFAATQTATVPIAAVDGIVVLTGGKHRVIEGLKLFEHARARRILISGVHPLTTREQLKRRAGVSQTLFSCCVDVGYKALDTSGNADETASWVDVWGFKRIAVVTSNYHMPRGLLELSRALPGTELVPHPVRSSTYGSGPWWTNAQAIRIVTIEYLKWLPAMARYGTAWTRGRLPDTIATTRQTATTTAIAVKP
jgi:uncharacterized SAM-binding protein YcdF (DUF218 family)